MTSLFSYLLTFLAVIFWAFRAVVTVMFQLDNPLFAQPSNVNYQIVVLFLTCVPSVYLGKKPCTGAIIPPINNAIINGQKLNLQQLLSILLPPFYIIIIFT